LAPHIIATEEMQAEQVLLAQPNLPVDISEEIRKHSAAGQVAMTNPESPGDVLRMLEDLMEDKIPRRVAGLCFPAPSELRRLVRVGAPNSQTSAKEYIRGIDSEAALETLERS
jgi:hypothetical protein